LPKIVAEIEELKKQILNQTMVKQKTIKTEISLTGVGLHTERSDKPAPVNNGFTFVQ
jgi:hypothetical protein